MLQRIKSYIIHYLISREMKHHQRTRQVVSPAKASSIGIIFAMESENDYQFVNTLIHQPALANKNFKVIGYVPGKEVPNFYMAKLKVDIFTQKDINFFGVPRKPVVEEFIVSKFDLLIEFSGNDYLPLEYIAGRSHANFKAGRQREQMIRVFDLLVKKNDGMQNTAFYKTLMDYLQTINY